LDAIDRLAMNARLHYLGSAARILLMYDLSANTLTEVQVHG
jgi:hypothetical protein